MSADRAGRRDCGGGAPFCAALRASLCAMRSQKTVPAKNSEAIFWRPRFTWPLRAGKRANAHFACSEGFFCVRCAAPSAGVAVFAVRGLRPDDGAVVPSENGIPPFSGGRCSIIGGHQLPAVKGVPQGTHGLDEFVVVLPGPFFDGPAGVIQRAPLLDFLHIFHDDDLRQNCLCVLVDRPGEDAEPLVPGLSAFGL